MNTPDVLDVYYWLVGVKRPPFLSHNIERQGGEFLKRGYTLEDLELTIRFLQRQIARANGGEKNTGGFNMASLTWKKLMGDYGASNELDDFNAKLALAREAQAKGWKPKLEYAAPTPTPVAATKATPKEATDEERAAMAAEMGNILAGLRDNTL